MAQASPSSRLGLALPRLVWLCMHAGLAASDARLRLHALALALAWLCLAWCPRWLGAGRPSTDENVMTETEGAALAFFASALPSVPPYCFQVAPDQEGRR
jgi:hypothetical protein